MPLVTRIILGKINGLYGVRGWVKVYAYTKPSANILTYQPWWLEQRQQWRQVQVAEGKVHGKGVIARLENINDRDAAAKLLGATIAVERMQLPPTDKDEYYWSDLEGMTVVTQQGITLGTVDYLLETGNHDVLVIKNTEQEHLIPFIGQYVLDVSLEQRLINVDWDTDF